MNGDECLSHNRLYDLLVEANRKLAILETRMTNLEEQMEHHMPVLARQAEIFAERTMVALYGIVGLLAVAGLTILLLLITGRL